MGLRGEAREKVRYSSRPGWRVLRRAVVRAGGWEAVSDRIKMAVVFLATILVFVGIAASESITIG